MIGRNPAWLARGRKPLAQAGQLKDQHLVDGWRERLCAAADMARDDVILDDLGAVGHRLERPDQSARDRLALERAETAVDRRVAPGLAWITRICSIVPPSAGTASQKQPPALRSSVRLAASPE